VRGKHLRVELLSKPSDQQKKNKAFIKEPTIISVHNAGFIKQLEPNKKKKRRNAYFATVHQNKSSHQTKKQLLVTKLMNPGLEKKYRSISPLLLQLIRKFHL